MNWLSIFKPRPLSALLEEYKIPSATGILANFVALRIAQLPVEAKPDLLGSGRLNIPLKDGRQLELHFYSSCCKPENDPAAYVFASNLRGAPGSDEFTNLIFSPQEQLVMWRPWSQHAERCKAAYEAERDARSQKAALSAIEDMIA